jgi:hypothetical protein
MGNIPPKPLLKRLVLRPTKSSDPSSHPTSLSTFAATSSTSSNKSIRQGCARKKVWLFAFSPPPLSLLPKHLSVTQPASVPFWEHSLLRKMDLLLSSPIGFTYLSVLRKRSLDYRRAGASESWRLAARDLYHALGFDLSRPMPEKPKRLGAGLMRPPVRVQAPRISGVVPPRPDKRKESFTGKVSS